jgi:acyl-CoA thioester hydrolase
VSSRYSHEFRVRYGECDPQGIVFNANYLAYFDNTFTEMWRDAFGSYGAMVERGIDMVVAAIDLEFRGSARFDELVRVEIAIARLGTTSMTSAVELLREDEPLVHGSMRHVFIDSESWGKTPAPDWVRGALEPWVAIPAPD